METPDTDDLSLIQRCRAGDTAAFDALVLRYQDQAFAVALRMLGDYHEAKEVAQDAFVRAYQGLEHFRAEAKFSTWLLTIVTNLCRNRRRWWARRKQYVVASLDEPVDTEEGGIERDVADPSPTPQQTAQQREMRAQILAMLGMLDESSRTAIVLRDIQGLSYEEMAQIMQCEIGTVKSRLNRARLQLRALLDGKL